MCVVHCPGSRSNAHKWCGKEQDKVVNTFKKETQRNLLLNYPPGFWITVNGSMHI